MCYTGIPDSALSTGYTGDGAFCSDFHRAPLVFGGPYSPCRGTEMNGAHLVRQGLHTIFTLLHNTARSSLGITDV